MEDAERQQLLDRIAAQAAEIAQLKQTIDALVRRIFGTKSEALDPAQLLLLLEADLAKKGFFAGFKGWFSVASTAGGV